jgi:hypothetical protein
MYIKVIYIHKAENTFAFIQKSLTNSRTYYTSLKTLQLAKLCLARRRPYGKFKVRRTAALHQSITMLNVGFEVLRAVIMKSNLYQTTQRYVPEYSTHITCSFTIYIYKKPYKNVSQKEAVTSNLKASTVNLSSGTYRERGYASYKNLPTA